MDIMTPYQCPFRDIYELLTYLKELEEIIHLVLVDDVLPSDSLPSIGSYTKPITVAMPIQPVVLKEFLLATWKEKLHMIRQDIDDFLNTPDIDGCEDGFFFGSTEKETEQMILKQARYVIVIIHYNLEHFFGAYTRYQNFYNDLRAYYDTYLAQYHANAGQIVALSEQLRTRQGDYRSPALEKKQADFLQRRWNTLVHGTPLESFQQALEQRVTLHKLHGLYQACLHHVQHQDPYVPNQQKTIEGIEAQLYAFQNE
jgi:hypothetical protein